MLESGKRPRGGVQHITEGVPSIGAEHLGPNGGFRFDKIKFVPRSFAESMLKGVLAVNDIVVVKDGATTGKTSLVRESFPHKFAVVNEHVFLCRLKDSVMPKWAFYRLWSSEGKKQILADFRGAAQGGISGSFVDLVTIPFPPVEEQERIVAKIEELFSELDAGVESLKKARAQLKIYRQSVLKHAFEGYLTNDNIKDGKLPERWKETTLGEIVEGVEYGSAAKSKESGEVPVLRMGNIQNGRFDWNDLVFTSDADEITRYKLRRDDVLFNRTNSAELVGKSAIYKGEQPAIFAGYLIRINRQKDKLDANYLNYFLNSHRAKSYGKIVMTLGVNQANINGTKLKSYPLPICTLGEQQRVVAEIESRLSVCDKMEEAIEAGLKQAEALRQSILKKAFEGKLVPQKVLSTEDARKVYFARLRMLAFILQYLGSKGFRPKQMDSAKYVYLIERIFGVRIYKEYQRLHLGPYNPEIKKTLFNKTYFKHTFSGIEILNADRLFKYPVPNKQQIQLAIDEITATFKKYKKRDQRIHKVELLATVCKVIEDIGTTELSAVRTSMKDWSVNLKDSVYTNKAEKFDETETAKCIKFIIEKGWNKKLLA